MTVRDDHLKAMLDIVDRLDGLIIGGDEIDNSDEPIRLMYVGTGGDLATYISKAQDRIVFQGLVAGEMDTWSVAESVLPGVRCNQAAGRWVWSKPWKAEDHQRLVNDHPQLVPDTPTWDGLQAELWPAYRDYFTNVSPYDMAMSFETATYILHLCRVTKPTAVTDFGSGFSSYLFRYYGGATVTSVDDNSEWLAKTMAFCREHLPGDTSTGWRLWPNHEVKSRSQNIVFHDLAGGDLRNTAMPFAMQAANDYAVVDDCHNEGHRETFYRLAKTLQFTPYSLMQTHDHIQRFSMLGVR